MKFKNQRTGAFAPSPKKIIFCKKESTFILKRKCVLLFFIFLSFFFYSCNFSEEGHALLPHEETDVLMMMYLDGDNNLNDVSWANLAMAEIGLMDVKDNAKVTVIALIDGKLGKNYGSLGDGKSHLYKLGAFSEREYYSSNLIAKSTVDYSPTASFLNGREADMSSGITLYNFLIWAEECFSAKKTVLVLQDHGGGPYIENKSRLDGSSSRVICQDDTSDGGHYISTKDVVLAIKKTFGKIDLLIEDACLQASIEEIYALQNSVNYLVASPNLTYSGTIPYDSIIPYISEGKSMEEIGKRIIHLNKEKCENLSLSSSPELQGSKSCMELSLTLIDCSKKEVLKQIKEETSNLADALLDDTKNALFYKKYVGKPDSSDAKNLKGFYFEASYVYTQDLGIMAYQLKNYKDSSQSVQTAAEKLYSTLKGSGLIVCAWAGGKGNKWYYSGLSETKGCPECTYGSTFLAEIANEGQCPWGISITSAERYEAIPLTNYSEWSDFGRENQWGTLLSEWN